jgi:hypothetical protein
MSKANHPSATQQPKDLADGPRHDPRRQPERGPARGLLGIPRPQAPPPPQPQPTGGPGARAYQARGAVGTGEEIELADPANPGPRRPTLQHLSPLFRAQTVDLIAHVLVGDTPTDTPAPEEEQDDANLFQNGGVDGTRTRDLRRDRPAF